MSVSVYVILFMSVSVYVILFMSVSVYVILFMSPSNSFPWFKNVFNSATFIRVGENFMLHSGSVGRTTIETLRPNKIKIIKINKM